MSDVSFNPKNVFKDGLGAEYLEVPLAGGGKGRLYQGELDQATLKRLDFNNDAMVSSTEAGAAVDSPKFKQVSRDLVTAEQRLLKAREPEPNWGKEILGAVGTFAGAGLMGGFLMGSFMVGWVAVLGFALLGAAAGLAISVSQYFNKRRTPEQHATELKGAEAGLQAARAAHAEAWKEVAKVELQPTDKSRAAVLSGLQAPRS